MNLKSSFQALPLADERGFTLIELISVIVILGILGAMAVPKYIDIPEDAHTAAALSTTGTFKEAVGLFHSAWVARGHPATIQTVPMNTAGYPGIDPTPTSSADCQTIWDGIINTSYPTTLINSLPEVVEGDPGWAAWYLGGPNCAYVYKSDIGPLRTIVYTTTTGQVIFFTV